MADDVALEERVNALEDALREVGSEICLVRTEVLIAHGKTASVRSRLAGAKQELSYCRGALTETAESLASSHSEERERIQFVVSRLQRVLEYVEEMEGRLGDQ